MKLRNKKTGEIIDLDEWSFDTYDDMFYLARGDAEGDNIEYFKSFADFMSKYEDYKPAEPLIKDEKIRKAMKVWARLNEVEEVTFDEYWHSFRDTDMVISFLFSFRDFDCLEDGKSYTIAELCGEEE